MKKILVALCLSALFISGGLSADDKVYRVAVDVDYPPFSYTDGQSGQLTGFDVDIAQAVFADLGLKCEIVTVPFDEIIPELEAGRLDVGCAGFAYTEERAKRVIYSEKYFRSNCLFLGLPGAFKDITPESIKDKNVAVQSGTRQETYLRTTYGDSIKILPVKGFGDIVEMIKDQRADLGFIDGLPGYHYLKSDDGLDLDIVGDPVHLPGGGSCMLLPKGSEALRDKINQAIQHLRQTGGYSAINMKYFDFNVY